MSGALLRAGAEVVITARDASMLKGLCDAGRDEGLGFSHCDGCYPS